MEIIAETQLNIPVVLFIHIDFVLFVLVPVLKALPLPSSMLTFLSSEVSSLLWSITGKVKILMYIICVLYDIKILTWGAFQMNEESYRRVSDTRGGDG